MSKLLTASLVVIIVSGFAACSTASKKSPASTQRKPAAMAYPSAAYPQQNIQNPGYNQAAPAYQPSPVNNAPAYASPQAPAAAPVAVSQPAAAVAPAYVTQTPRPAIPARTYPADNDSDYLPRYYYD